MDINVFAIMLMTTILGLYSWRAYLHQNDYISPINLPWVPINVNKSRSFVNQTRDAGMYVERQRRSAVISGPSLFSYKDSTNGSLDYYLTGILIGDPKPICPVAPNVIWSVGGAADDVCDNVDAGGAFGMYDVIDFGGAVGNDCDV